MNERIQVDGYLNIDAVIYECQIKLKARFRLRSRSVSRYTRLQVPFYLISIMANDESDSTNSSGGRSLGGGASQPLPASWARPSDRPRVGRIGDWSGTDSSA